MGLRQNLRVSGKKTAREGMGSSLPTETGPRPAERGWRNKAAARKQKEVSLKQAGKSGVGAV